MNDEANDYQKQPLHKIYATFYELKEDNFIRLTNIYKQKGYSPTFIFVYHKQNNLFIDSLD